MISRINGKIVDKKEGSLLIGSGGISYEVLLPQAVMKAISPKCGADIDLVTYHYYQLEPSRATPMLIGFQNEIEKEFFEKFISVSGIGPKAACRALAEPFSTIAGAIDSGDTVFLKGLPGIGERKAGEIVAKLKGKVGKYGLIRDGFVSPAGEREDIKEEAIDILIQLQYKRAEAEEMVRKAVARNPNLKTSEDLLNEVYRERVIR